MLAWFAHGFSTYFLHSQHGLGYQFWSSGPGPGLGQVAILGAIFGLYKHKACEQPHCWRLGHPHPDHQRPVCRRHFHDVKAPGSSKNSERSG